MAASACLLLAAFVQIPRLLSARYGIPPAPTRQYFHPGVPYEAFVYTRQTVVQASGSDAPGDFVPRIEEEHPSPRIIRVEKLALAELNKPSVSQSLSSDPSSAQPRSPQSNTP